MTTEFRKRKFGWVRRSPALTYDESPLTMLNIEIGAQPDADRPALSRIQGTKHALPVPLGWPMDHLSTTLRHMLIRVPGFMACLLAANDGVHGAHLGREIAE